MKRLLSISAAMAASILFAACGAGGAAEDLFGVGAGDIPGIPGGGAPPIPGSGETMSQAELDWAMEVHSLTNQVRSQNGRAPLAWHADAAQAAFDHCLYQQGEGDISHEGVNGSTPGQRLTAAGVSWSTAGENVAVGQPTPQAVVNGWVGSPGHFSNMIHPAFTQLGVGCQTGPGGPYFGPWWTQKFFAP